MTEYSADLHIHTVLSPCGSLDMAPKTIVNKAKEKHLDIIGITDHNHTGHCRVVSEIASQHQLFVLCGAEVTTREDAHCLAFFPSFALLNNFQLLLDKTLRRVTNKPELFGHQVIVNREEEILQEIEPLLISATTLSVDELEAEVHRRGGLFIPAHVNRSAYSLTSQLGFVPPSINADALEISKHITKEQFRCDNPALNKFSLIRSSDAHFPEDIGAVNTRFSIKEPSFEEIRKALHREDGRAVL